jgi:uncharacterized protein (TIGR00730 family)
LRSDFSAASLLQKSGEKHVKTICVLAGSKNGVRTNFIEIANKLGAEIGKAGAALICGGASKGLMAACADSAHFQLAPVTVVIPHNWLKGEPQPLYAHVIPVADQAAREAEFMARADGFIALPGAATTLGEVWNLLSAKHYNKDPRPLVLLDQGQFWRGTCETITRMVGEEQLQFGLASHTTHAATAVQRVLKIAPAAEP